jgi:hypothetical protein
VIRGSLLILLAALLLAAPAVDAMPRHAKKLTCARAERLHVRKLSRHERKRVLAARRRCSKAKRKAATGPATGSSPSSPSPTTSSPSATPTPEPPTDYTAPPPDSNPRALQVISGEFFLNLSKGAVLSGPVRVEFNNAYAEDPHDLHLVREDGSGTSYAFGTLDSGGIEARTLDLSKGIWQLFCALPQHASRGMTAKLTVG